MPWEVSVPSEVGSGCKDEEEWSVIGAIISRFIQRGRHCCNFSVESAEKQGDSAAEIWMKAPQGQHKQSDPVVKPATQVKPATLFAFPDSSLPAMPAPSSSGCSEDGADRQAPTPRECRDEGAPAAKPEKAGEWAKACLSECPSVEVFVIDSETGKQEWVTGVPKSRVSESSGQDAFLYVEYAWEGVPYEQDFGPEHVRKCGDTRTMFDVWNLAAT